MKSGTRDFKRKHEGSLRFRDLEGFWALVWVSRECLWKPKGSMKGLLVCLTSIAIGVELWWEGWHGELSQLAAPTKSSSNYNNPLSLEVRNRFSLYISKSSILCSITKLWIEFQTQLWPAWTVLILGGQQCIMGGVFRSLKLTTAYWGLIRS